MTLPLADPLFLVSPGWGAILVAALVAYALRLAGLVLALRLPPTPGIERALSSLAVPMLAALVSVSLARDDFSSALGAAALLALVQTRIPPLLGLATVMAGVAWLRAP